MKTKFTKASAKDKTLVTVSLSTLEDGGIVIKDVNGRAGNPTELLKGDNFVLEVDGVPTVFTVNREGKTARTHSLPRHLRLPTLKRPTYGEVSKFGIMF